MDKRLLDHIAHVANHHRTWVRVSNSNAQVVYSMIVSDEIKTVTLRALTLESYRNHYGFKRDHTWQVSEHDLRRGLVALYAKDPSARGRATTLHLSNDDVEYIIEKATYGIVKLELDQYGLW